MANAVSRLAEEEAKQALSFDCRGVRDITRDFTIASNQLLPGQLVKDDFFTLFESVGALEIMDPKMDSGCVPENDTFEPDFDLSAGMKVSECLWIIDQLLCLEITWHDGYPLSQTVFTSLHIDRLLSPEHEKLLSFYDQGRTPPNLTAEQEVLHSVLRAYCIALIKCCHLALHLIQSQTFYEEEDFVTHLFGRELLPRVGSSAALQMLDEAINQVGEVELPSDMREAIIIRLRFRQRLLKALTDNVNYWKDMIDDIKDMKTSHELATPMPDAFSLKVQRQLATSTPPRPMLQVSWDLACTKLKSLLEDVVAAHRLTSLNIVQSPARLQRAVWAFSSRGQSSALARAELQDILFGDQAIGGGVPHYDLLLTDIRDLVLAGDPLVDPQSFQIEFTSDPRHICSRLMEGFIDKVMDEYLNLYRMVCQNRCRIRRLFTQVIPILDALESEAMRTDQELSKFAPSLKMRDKRTGKMVTLDPLTSWAKFYKLRVMAWTVQLGFETEIYLPDELSGIYWFLSRICEKQCRLIEHIQRFTTERMRNAGDKNSAAECRTSSEWLKSMSDHFQATLLISEALWKTYALLTHLGMIISPGRDFADPQLLYEARMKPFLNVVNDTIPGPQEFEDATEQTDGVEKTCKAVDERIRTAKALIAGVKKLTAEQGKYVGTEDQWKSDIKRLETSCVAIAVNASQLLRAHARYGYKGLKGALECTPEKKYHEWWVIPQLKERKTK